MGERCRSSDLARAPRKRAPRSCTALVPSWSKSSVEAANLKLPIHVAHCSFTPSSGFPHFSPRDSSMSKRTTKPHASSARAAFGSAFGGSSSTFSVSSSQLSYVTEPPDLSAISDPNVVVYFRNLSKKDSTTKAKALEDIQARISSLQEPVEEGILEAWVGSTPIVHMFHQ
jgi:hypothetical protein